jgi:hypothetical protein
MIPVSPHYSTPKFPKRQAGPPECKDHLATPQFRILVRSRASAMMAWGRPHYRYGGQQRPLQPTSITTVPSAGSMVPSFATWAKPLHFVHAAQLCGWNTSAVL